jgi:tetratricopeptide (TPR) repeat protein
VIVAHHSIVRHADKYSRMNAPLNDLDSAIGSAHQALQRGEAGRARDLLEAALAAVPGNAAAWLALALARGKLGDDPGRGAALDQALACEPRNLRALIAKADHLAQSGDQRAAASFYSAALAQASRTANIPADLKADLGRAQAANQRVAQELESFLRSQLDREGFSPEQVSPRFSRSVDILFGKKRAYQQQPRYLFFSELPPIQFYPREQFPWLDEVEAATRDIRTELETVLSRTPAFGPYLTQDPSRPKSSKALVGNPNWGAFFLYKDEKEQPGAAQCPHTMAALANAPLTRIPNRAPSILFSKLAAKTQIPPHTGMINARLICHLPLKVPDGCGFRVGNEIRNWVEGKAWVFDDTIEHEAWNHSDVDRYILLFDIWRPELSEGEREAVASLCRAIDAFAGGGQAWDA